MNEREKILNFAFEKFTSEGYYKTTMDDLATELRMSKKTIYKYFTSKQEIVNAVVDKLMNFAKGEVLPIIHSETNSVEKLVEISRFFFKISSRLSSKFVEDIRSYDLELWKKIHDFRSKMIFENFQVLLDQGKKEEYIIDRPTIIMVTMFVTTIREVVNPDFIINNNFSLAEAGRITLELFHNAILTKKGRKIYKQYITGMVQ